MDDVFLRKNNDCPKIKNREIEIIIINSWVKRLFIFNLLQGTSTINTSLHKLVTRHFDHQHRLIQTFYMAFDYQHRLIQTFYMVYQLSTSAYTNFLYGISTINIGLCKLLYGISTINIGLYKLFIWYIDYQHRLIQTFYMVYRLSTLAYTNFLYGVSTINIGLYKLLYGISTINISLYKLFI